MGSRPGRSGGTDPIESISLPWPPHCSDRKIGSFGTFPRFFPWLFSGEPLRRSPSETVEQCRGDIAVSQGARRYKALAFLQAHRLAIRAVVLLTPRAQRGDETLHFAASYAARFSERSTKERPPTASLFAV
jgi:hypothetical protein